MWWIVANAAHAGLDTGFQAGAGAAMMWNPCIESRLGAAPFVFGTFDFGSERGVWGFLGVDSSTFLEYSNSVCGDVYFTNALMLTGGVWFGSDLFRWGGLASFGLGGIALGFRMALLPVRTGEWRHGLEIRVETLPLSDPTLFSLSYAVAVP